MPVSTPEGGAGKRWRPRRGVVGGLVLVAIGAYLLLGNLGLLPPIEWRLVWPILLILLGVWILIRRFT